MLVVVVDTAVSVERGRRSDGVEAPTSAHTGPMRRTIEADIDAPAQRVYDQLCVLDGYPDWLDVVTRVDGAPAGPADPGPAWLVTLRAQVGPFARSKRLRMVRTAADAPSSLRFERIELDGRRHSPWVLDVTVTDSGASSRARVDLHYDGGLWSPVLDAVLGSEIDTAVPRLQATLAR
jgi:hypothetical protein